LAEAADQACLMWLLQTKEEFNNEMQSLTSKHSQDIEEVKALMSALQVCLLRDLSVSS